MTPTQKQALEAALSALESERIMAKDDQGNYNKEVTPKRILDAIAKVKAALAEPVVWEGGEEWESLAWQLCADENGEDACTELIWEGGAIPEPWGDRWLKYEGEAKRLIALVKKHTSPQPREWQELSEAAVNDCFYTQAIGVGVDPRVRAESWLDIYKMLSAALRAKNGG